MYIKPPFAIAVRRLGKYPGAGSGNRDRQVSASGQLLAGPRNTESLECEGSPSSRSSEMSNEP